ncbi:DUF2231 domain-containing protein [Sphingomicrobium arenosum]|uniref:DUF2231 domain-containing protein n=1 Tax=Sphingomicrobium arenosum TaxID=2233861 RepID=UPI0022409196|nr:DUF2231 domain-containing protein [Sphingomicrobium arenosum]
MTSALRLVLSLLLLLSAQAALAHGGEKHGAAKEQSAVTEVAPMQPDHDMAAMDHAMTVNDAPVIDDEVSASEGGVMGALESLHPATVHFPIALFLMAAITEFFVVARPKPEREGAVRIMLYGGAFGGVVAALFGWIHTGLWFAGDTVMQIHRWNGVLIAVLGVVAAWIAHRRPRSRLALRLLLFPIAGLLIVQGFMGGELAHGFNHLQF